MPEIRIEAFDTGMTAEASRMLGRAFATNPVNVAALGPDRPDLNEAFFRIGLGVMKGPKWVAIEGSRIVGLIHWIDAPGCQFSGIEKLRMFPSMIGGLGLRPALRVSTWLAAWEKHEPEAAHCHLGPIGVEPDAQGRGIGPRLMDVYCAELDRAKQTGYLETDRPSNVDFYRRFGFEVIREAPVLGVPNFFMERATRSDSPDS